MFVNGEPESAKLILRDLVNAIVGFEALAVFAAVKRALAVEVHTQW